MHCTVATDPSLATRHSSHLAGEPVQCSSGLGMPNGVIRTDTRTGRTTAEARRDQGMLDKPRDKAPAVEFRKEMLGKEGMLIGMHATEFSMDGQLSLPRTCPKLGSPHHGTLEIQADQHPSSRSGLFRQ